MFFPDEAVRAGNHFRGGVTARHRRTAVPRYGDVPILLKVLAKTIRFRDVFLAPRIHSMKSQER
jgi:hypothetical protein